MSSRSRIPFLTLGLLTATLAMAFAPAALREACILSRDSVGLDHLSQLWSAHFVHWNTSHLLMNLASAALAFSWLEFHSRGLWLRILAFGSPTIGSLTMLSMQELESYCGLSGLIFAALGALIVLNFQKGPRNLGLLLLVLVGLKLGSEYLHPGPWFSGGTPAFVIARSAHWVGLFFGALVAFAKPWRSPIR